MPFMLQGVCPVCGNVNTVYNPPLPMNQTDADRYQNEHYPWTVFRCYHKGTPHHDNINFTASAGALYPMHLFYRREDEKDYRRYHPEANDDCNRRHWKVPKEIK